MNYLSVCSGIEAATVAWHSLGWTPLAFSEIEKFPSQVLAHHYPNTPNLGDMTRFKEWNFESDVNVLVGGTPCQSFSVAGLRKGLDDPRGNLMLTYLAIAAKQRPKWVVWENVPGVLSSNGGLDFASFLRGLGQLGYGFAYRVLDAQYFGVAQRRRRVFVVGCAGDWRAAAAVLFERHSLQGHPAPSREKREGVAASVGAGASSRSWPADISSTLDTTFGTKQGLENQHINAGCPMFVPAQPVYEMHGQDSRVRDLRETCSTVTSKWGTGGGNVPVALQPIALAENTIGRQPQNGGNGDGFTENGPMYTLNATGVHGVMQPINIYGGNKRQDRPEGGFYVRMDENISKTLDSATGLNPTCSQGGTAVMQPIPIDTMNIRGRPSDDGRGNRIGRGYGEVGDPMFTITKANHHAVCLMDQGGSVMTIENDITGTLRRETHGHEPVVMQPIAFDMAQITSKANGSRAEPGLPTGTLAKGSSMHVAVGTDLYNGAITGDVAASMTKRADGTGTGPTVMQAMAVRRLTPVECERLQGFPDNYTDIQPKGKATPDGPRYKALGNSMAVPVMAWIGERIAQVEGIA